eukprot:scaffold648650_cov38-Prasinocladus_malaysianus.AAC.1
MRLDDASEQVSLSIRSAHTTANLTEHAAQEGFALVDYMAEYLDNGLDKDPFMCVRESMNSVPGMLADVLGSLKQAQRLLFQPGQL